MSIKIKTISTVQLPPPKCRKNLFHVVLTDYVPDFTVRHIFLSIHAGLRNKNKNGFLFAREIVAVRPVFTAYFMKSVCQRR